MSSADSSSSRKLPLWPLLLIAILLGIAVFGDKGVLRALQLNRQKQDLQAEVRRIEETKAALDSEIESLRSDHRYIENIARRELGMVKEDEVVYQFIGEKPREQTDAGEKGADE